MSTAAFLKARLTSLVRQNPQAKCTSHTYLGAGPCPEPEPAVSIHYCINSSSRDLGSKHKSSALS